MLYVDNGELVFDWYNRFTLSIGWNAFSVSVGRPDTGIGFLWERGRGFCRL